MTIPTLRGALVLAAVLAGGCQTNVYQPSRPMTPVATTPMDGVWASSDGVFVANFERGHFTSRFTATNEILAQGAYTVAAGGISMQWISAATKQQRAASCSFAGSDIVTCNQEGGGHFELRRSAASQTMPAPAVQPAAATPAPAGAQPTPG
jgi:hypothetical protein